MDFDFHYYGTYAAARMANFSDVKAREIAIAAQFVDEFHSSGFASIMAAKLSGEQPCYTAFKLDDTYDAIISSFNSDATLAKIWVPYHFMPVNGSNDTIAIDGVMHNITNESAKYYQYLIAGPYGALYNKVMDLEGVTTANDTMAIGLKMHVLADTYAHQGFIGIRQEAINAVENTYEVMDDGVVKSQSSSYLIQFGAIGHADLGHNPDIGYRTIKYRPHWNEKINIVERDNVRIFSLAFGAMYSALYKINNGGMCATVQQVQEAINKAETIVSVVSDQASGSEFQEHQWLAYISKCYNEATYTLPDVAKRIADDKASIVDYFALNTSELQKFNAAAQNHYAMVRAALPKAATDGLL